MRRLLPLLGLLALAPLAAAQASNVRLGVSVNGYFFTDHRLRNAFGNPALAYGANLTEITGPTGSRSGLAYDFITASKGDSLLFVVLLTFGLTRVFADKQATTIPYARLAAGGAYYDV